MWLKRKRHNLRLKEGRWVCSGGERQHGRLGCDFVTPEYDKAVNHATQNGAVPPDMPKEMWA